MGLSSGVEERFDKVLCHAMSTPPLDYSASPQANITFNGVHNAAIQGRSAYKSVEGEV